MSEPVKEQPAKRNLKRPLPERDEHVPAAAAATAAAATPETTDHTEEMRRHGLFIQALDGLPPNCLETEWLSAISVKLGWDLRQVEAHAYRYFVALVEHDQVQRLQPGPDDWTAEESILFDTLVALYHEGKDHPSWTWVTDVAGYFPRRTPADIWHRWEHFQKNRSSAASPKNGKANGNKGS